MGQTNQRERHYIQDIAAENDKFALRFIYTADFCPRGKKIDVEVCYFYHLSGGKVTEFWTVSSADYDYRAKGTEDMPTK